MTNLESEDSHVSSELVVLIREQEKATDWLDRNQLADLKSNDRPTF